MKVAGYMGFSQWKPAFHAQALRRRIPKRKPAVDKMLDQRDAGLFSSFQESQGETAPLPRPTVEPQHLASALNLICRTLGLTAFGLHEC